MSTAAKIDKIYSLSPMQEGVLYHALQDEKSTAYFEHITFTMKGEVRLDLLEKTVNILIQKYDNYRTIFIYQKVKKPKQVVLKERSIKVQFEDITHLIKEKQLTYIEKFKHQDRVKGFDLSKEILIRFTVFKTDEETYQIVWGEHLLSRDGWGFGIIAKDFFQIYKQLNDNQPLKLEPVAQFHNYIKWLEKQDTNGATEYWRGYLKEYEQIIVIPSFKNSKKIKDYEQTEVMFSIDERSTESLKKLANNLQVTLSTIFQTIWGVMLQRYNNVDDAVFGAVVSGRPHEIPGIESMVGLFVNTVPVRVKYEEKETFSTLAKKIQAAAHGSANYEYLPLAEIQACSNLKQGLFDHIVVFENYPLPDEIQNISDGLGSNISITDVKVDERTSFNFNMEITLHKDGMGVRMYYNALVHDREFVQSIEGHFKQIAHQVIQNPEIIVAELEMVTKTEKRKILEQFNKPVEKFIENNKTIYQLFEEQALKNPDNTALVFEGQELSYRELHQRVNCLAVVLREKGIGPETIVGLMVYRSFEMIVGIFGILKAGGAYLPIDPKFPQERIQYMFKDSEACLLLTQSHLRELAQEVSAEVLILDDNDLYQGEEKHLDIVNKSSDLVYIIYTSGSTGRPKAVLLEHSGVINILRAMQEQYPLTSMDAYLLKTAYTFDVSVTEIFGWFFDGGKLVILNPGDDKEPGRIVDMIANHKITHLNFVPSMLEMFINFYDVIDLKKVESLKYVFVAGEAISRETVSKFYSKFTGIQLENIYGPTESTIYATNYPLDNLGEEINVPIGKPLPNIQTYILSKGNKLQPVGALGELVLAGAGLARGYLNQDELTKEKFRNNPFLLRERMYMTGDLVRWLPDGNIEFLGRIDDQIKVRGFRIELNEIKNQILSFKSVQEVVVLSRKDTDGNNFIVAYVVADKDLKIADLREYLKGVLPDYMIPLYFTQIEQIPLNISGKVDRKALPTPQASIDIEQYEPPSTELEKQLVAIWEEVLEVENVGITQSFFDLGGHSLKAVRVVSNTVKLGINLRINDILDLKTIKEISNYLMGSSVKEKIKDLNEAENLITEHLKTKSTLWKYQVNQNCYIVLHIEKSEDRQSLLDLIKENLDESISPQYIHIGSSEPWRESLTVDEFNGLLNLKTDNPKRIWDQFKVKVESGQRQLCKAIMTNARTGKYPIAPIQKYHLKESEFQMVGLIITFKNYLNISILKKAILHVISEQRLLRSSLVQEEGQYFWQEYESPQDLIIPSIDLSIYDNTTRSEVLTQLISQFYFKPYNLSETLPYRMLVVKENEKESLFILPFSHVAYDIMSNEILKKQILDYYQYYTTMVGNPEKIKQTYWEYIEQVCVGPQQIADEELIDFFELAEMVKYSNPIQCSINNQLSEEFTRVDLEVPQIMAGIQSDLIWEKTFEVVNHFFKSYFNVTKVPIWIVNYGRRYGDKSYFDLVGEFIDIVPLLIDVDERGLSEITETVQSKIQKASDHNINFSNLIFGFPNPQFEKSRVLLEQLINGQGIFFNFQGKFEQEDLSMIKNLIHDQMVLNNVNKFMVEVKYTAKKIRFDFLLPFKEDVNVLKNMFLDAIKKSNQEVLV